MSIAYRRPGGKGREPDTAAPRTGERRAAVLQSGDLRRQPILSEPQDGLHRFRGGGFGDQLKAHQTGVADLLQAGQDPGITVSNRKSCLFWIFLRY